MGAGIQPLLLEMPWAWAPPGGDMQRLSGTSAFQPKGFLLSWGREAAFPSSASQPSSQRGWRGKNQGRRKNPVGRFGWNAFAGRFHGSWWAAIGLGRGARRQREVMSQGMGQEGPPWAEEKAGWLCVRTRGAGWGSCQSIRGRCILQPLSIFLCSQKTEEPEIDEPGRKR